MSTPKEKLFTFNYGKSVNENYVTQINNVALFFVRNYVQSQTTDTLQRKKHQFTCI